MRFSIILFGFYLLIKLTAWKFKDFKNLLKEKNFTMTITTFDYKRKRFYSFKDGNITSKRKTTEHSDFALEWIDAKTGFYYLKKGSPKKMISALKNKDLKLTGDAGKVQWFLGILKELQRAWKKA